MPASTQCHRGRPLLRTVACAPGGAHTLNLSTGGGVQQGFNRKNTTNNSANFFTTSISYHPDWFVISNKDNLYVTNQLSILPKWGIRRNIAFRL